LAEINVKAPGQGQRRAFRVYVEKAAKVLLDKAVSENAERKELRIENLDVIDFPTPMIALRDFIDNVDQPLLRNSNPSALGYWKAQRTIQYEGFFEQLDETIEKEQIPSVTYFDFENVEGFKLPRARRPARRGKSA
jgi:hypothetical protein